MLLGVNVDDVDMESYATTATTYARPIIGDRFTNTIDRALDALSALKVLSDALGADANFSTTVTDLIGTKANTADVTASLRKQTRQTSPHP